MLESTFIHLPNFSYTREKKLWQSGINNWYDFLDKFNSSDFHKQQCKIIASSSYALKCADAEFFAKALPSGETWRAFPDFKKIAYLDIETTGLSPEHNDLTVIGIYDGENTKSYIHGINLNEFVNDIKEYDMAVSFNGSVFDMPFLRKSFPKAKMPKLHIDLRFLLSSLNVWGGLKKIEAKFGLEREDDLKGLNGYDAVKMWQEYKKTSSEKVLDRLVRYNAADICNLKVLAEWAYDEKKKLLTQSQ